MRLLKLAIPVLGLGVFGACGSDSDGGGCPDLSGTWSVDGTCTTGQCELDQNGCNFTFNCDDGRELTGRVRNDSLEFSQDDEDIECSAELDKEGDQPEDSGSCETPQGECTFSAQCESGDCLEASGGTGGGGGTGGSGGRGGNAGTGGSGGSGPGSDCEVGAVGVCSCLVGTAEECAEGDEEILAAACEDGEPDTEWISCFADYVGESCADAAAACIDEEPVAP
ncbi:MAG TPA: hypothetical protein VK524_12250 [Polyangiaceae bacterium]|nr:hypothetical protein [Polyangiaceae bacterium]